jgi:hypothetical protein
MGRVPDDGEDRIAYNYRPTRELWGRWKRTVPRDIALYDRLDRLLELDAEHDLDGLVERDGKGEPAGVEALTEAIEQADPPDNEVRLAAVRIRRRCMTALPAAREAGADTAADELAEIQQIANDLLDLDE